MTNMSYARARRSPGAAMGADDGVSVSKIDGGRSNCLVTDDTVGMGTSEARIAITSLVVLTEGIVIGRARVGLGVSVVNAVGDGGSRSQS